MIHAGLVSWTSSVCPVQSCCEPLCHGPEGQHEKGGNVACLPFRVQSLTWVALGEQFKKANNTTAESVCWKLPGWICLDWRWWRPRVVWRYLESRKYPWLLVRNRMNSVGFDVTKEEELCICLSTYCVTLFMTCSASLWDYWEWLYFIWSWRQWPIPLNIALWVPKVNIIVFSGIDLARESTVSFGAM